MEIEIRLKLLLQELNLDRHGTTQEMARDLGVHRHTIGKLYRNQLSNPPLKLLGRVCDWLQARGLEAPLPQALLGVRPAELWQAVARPGAVTIYLGEYCEPRGKAHPMLWIARRDASVAAEIVRALTTTTVPGSARPRVSTEYVPFRLVGAQCEAHEFAADVHNAVQLYKDMRSGGVHSSVLIGSQRVQYLTEQFVAGLFGARPFTPSQKSARAPIYVGYRGHDRLVPSCFGGTRNPPGCRLPFRPGILYLDKNGKWVQCPWVLDKEDSGVVIVAYDKGTRRVDMAIFGFSGRATEVIGTELLRMPQLFWRADSGHKGVEVGVYICRFHLADNDDAASVTHGAAHVKDFQVIPMDARILDQFLAR